MGERNLELLTIQQCLIGSLVEPDNEKELTLAVAILLRDESYRRNIGIAPRGTILDKLTWRIRRKIWRGFSRESIEEAAALSFITQSGKARKPQNENRGT